MAMLGSSCSPCCDPCSCLPETVTLTIDGFSEGETPGRWLCPLAFEACYGTGAEARVAEPGGNADTDKGPISSVEVTKGGSGYAKIGRVAPTVTVTGTSGSGTGATFDVTLASSKDACNVDRWAVSKVVRTGGDGYANGDTLTFAIANGDTQEAAATAEIAGTIYAEPTLSLSVAGGTGAVLEIDGYTKSGDYWGFDFADTWRISGITVANGGSGYTNNASVTVTLGQNDEARPGAGTTIRIVTAFRAPADDWTLQNGTPAPTGTGLVLSLTLAIHPTTARTYWVNSWAITNGGTGYAVGQRIRPLANEGNNAPSPLRANLEITAVDSNGAVTALDLVGTTTSTRNTSRGRYCVDSGVITSVTISSQAGWRKALTNPDGVLVTNGGIYYREDANAPAYVSPVTISVTQSLPSAGTGASLSAVIDNVPSSPTFGQITGVDVDSGGDDYLAYEWCEANLQGTTVVLPRSTAVVVPGGFVVDSGDCYYGKEDCGRSFNVVYRGLSFPPRIVLYTTCNSQQVRYELEASENVTDCSQIAFTASDNFGRSASVTAGGVPSGTGCTNCTGNVLVNGVAVPMNPYGIDPPGYYTVVSVDPAPTIVTGPGGLQQFYRTYAVAQAINLGCTFGLRGEPEMWIRFWCWIVVYSSSGYNIQWQGSPIMAEFDALAIGSTRANNPLFISSYSSVYDAYEDRLLGPIRGNACVGNDWYFLGGYDTFTGLGAPIGFPPVPDPPSAVVARVGTRQTAKGTLQCGPI